MTQASYQQRYGDNALIVGASATIGEQFARQLAARGMNVYLVARNENSLNRIAAEIKNHSKVEAHVLALDLLSEGALEQLFEKTRHIDISYLVVNANLHKIDNFNAMPVERKLKMIQMNILMPTLLCHHYGPEMTAKGKGGIMLVSAMDFLMGLEKDAVFQGSKAYVSIFAESLWMEYRRQGVHVASALMNAIEGSESYEAKTSRYTRRLLKWMGISMQPKRIVARCLAGFEKERHIVIPDYPVPVARMGYTLMALSKIFRAGWYVRMLSAFILKMLNGENLTK